MYVTRRLSHLLKFPDSLSLLPEGPNSGFLVIKDEESETTKNSYLNNLPFPQNKNLTIRLVGNDGPDTKVALIPVLNQPLSSNQYYAIKPSGSHTGEAYTCSNEDDMANSFFGCCIQDVSPRPLDPTNTYQLFEIYNYEPCFGDSGFSAKSVAPDGFPPFFLRSQCWVIYTKTPKNFELGEAKGIDAVLRAKLPGFSFPLHCKSSAAVVVGRWYCPFMFIIDGTLTYQTEKSRYYEMTLEQQWEQISRIENAQNQGNVVYTDVEVQMEELNIGGRKGVWSESNDGKGVVWFKSPGVVSIGLSSLIVDRMKWEEERGGWVRDETSEGMRVKRRDEFSGVGAWNIFGCYMLVERFVLKRMDGSIVLTYTFKHTHVIRSKWE